MNPAVWKDFGLKENPFRVTPPTKGEPIVWAGLGDHKKKVERTLKVSLIQTSSKMLVFYGEWGCGKTHVMRYFTTDECLNSLSGELNLGRQPLPIVVTMPRINVFEEIYVDILREINIERIEDSIRFICKQLKKKGIETIDEQLKELGKITKDTRLAKILYNLLLSEEKGKKLLVEKYLLMEAQSKDLKELEIPIGIETTNHMLQTLTGIFNIFTAETEHITEPYSPRILLWLDEVENIKAFSGRDTSSTRGFIRDLIDYMSSKLLILLNFTLSSGEEIEDLMVYLGDAVRSRVSRYIRFYELSTELTKDQAMEYINDLLNHELYRLENVGVRKNKLFPFSEETLKATMDIIEKKSNFDLTPRRINDILSNILEIAIFDQQILSKIKSFNPIPQDFIIKNTRDVFGDELKKDENKNKSLM